MGSGRGAGPEAAEPGLAPYRGQAQPLPSPGSSGSHSRLATARTDPSDSGPAGSMSGFKCSDTHVSACTETPPVTGLGVPQAREET
ncbi:hypothetical protein WISP_83790 [Willisornis vidua]|uniref:Uncharacterized protein n=1 Tax=Willisornis vidua TaxID=1566151 RepID=A0ABQ9D6M0_9PASS|nr:hypothetical protein WISP_83790 [Willisornis vidua]